MAFQNIDWEALVKKDSELPTDVTFKVYENDSVLVQDGDSDKIKTDAFRRAGWNCRSSRCHRSI